MRGTGGAGCREEPARACCQSRTQGEIQRIPILDEKNLAAAIRTDASVIVAFNERDFPAEALEPHGIKAQQVDLFIDNLFDLNPAAVVVAAQRQRGRLKQSPLSVDTYLNVLLKQGHAWTMQAAEQVPGDSADAVGFGG